MITSSYLKQSEYTASLENGEHGILNPSYPGEPQVTEFEEITRYEAKELLNPDHSQSLAKEYPNDYEYRADNTASGINKMPEQGWTTRSASPGEGGMVRNALLSGSYGELRKLRVDSEVNSETVTTSWSASIGENLRVGNNAGVAGYVNLGDTASLVSGSNQPGRNPQHVFAPNAENVPDLRLIVSDSALIKEDLYVKDSASVSGGLDVKGDTRLAHDLFVTGNTQMTGTLRVVDRTYLTGSVQVVGNEAVTGSLHVSKSIYGSENFYLTGNAEITGNAQIVGNEAVTGSLHVSKSIYGSENLYITGNTEITGTLRVVDRTYLTGSVQIVGDEAVTGSVNIRENLWVTGSASVTGTLNVSGNTDLHSNLSVDHSASVLDLYVTKSARVGENLGVYGNEYLTGSLYVKQDAVITRSLFVNGDANVTGNLTVHQSESVKGDVTIDNDLKVKGTASIDKTLIVYGKETVEDNLEVRGDVYVTGSENIDKNLYVSGSAGISGNLYVSGNTEVSSSLTVHGDQIIDGEATFNNNAHFLKNVVVEHDLVVNGTASYMNVDNLYVKDKSITVASGSTSPAAANGAGIDIAGANVEFRYTSSTDRMGLNKGLDVNGDENITGSLKVTGNEIIEQNLHVSGNTAITGNLGVRGNVDIQSSHFSMSEASIINGVANISRSVNTTDVSASNNTSTKNLYVANSASINVAKITQSYVASEVVTQSLVLTQSVSQSTVQSQVVTQSLVLTQSVSHSTVLSQSVQSQSVQTQSVLTQSVVSQSVISSSMQQLDVKSGSFQDIQIVSGNAEYIKTEKLVVTSTDPAEFQGDVVVRGNLSGSKSGSFRDLYVENNATIGNTASVDKFLNVKGDGVGNSVVVDTGSIDARNSDLFVHNITGSGLIYMPYFSGGVFYGDGRGLINVTASAASSSTWKSYVSLSAGGTYRVTHPFHTTDVFVQVYKWDDPNFHPSLGPSTPTDPDTPLNPGVSFSSPAIRVNDATVKIIEDGIVDISYPQDLNGYAVISDAGMIITASVDVLQVASDYAEFNVTSGNEKTIYRFDHKLGTKNLIVQVYQNADIKDGAGTVAPVQIFPEQISIPDISHVDIVFGRAPINGYIVLGKAGHVVRAMSDPQEWIDQYNVHYGTQGNWVAKSWTGETASVAKLKVAEYIDAYKIGIRDVEPQYYHGADWGSYITFEDKYVTTFVKPSEGEDPIAMAQVKSNGDLQIRGALVNDGNFSLSDRNYKTEITTITGSLDAVKRMTGVSFRWRKNNELSLGVIAQDLEAIYPELTKVVTNLDQETQMTVNYDGLIGVLIEAVKELSAKVESLEQQIAQ